MFVLLIIVSVAVFVLWLSNMDRKRPAALVMMGLVCVILGGRAVGLLSGSYSDQYLGVAYADERDAPAAALPGTATEILGEVSGDDELLPTATGDRATPVSSSTKPHPLTIEPIQSFRYLTLPRPEWVETEASKGDDCYQIAVESGLHLRKRTAQQSLQAEVKAAVDEYVNDYLQSELASKLSGYSIEEGESGSVRTINLHLDGQTFEIARERFDEQVEFDYGVMNQSHALVKIDKNVKQALDQHWSKVRAASRLLQAGLGVGAVLLLLGTMFGYLRLDTATRGYYTGRLQFGAAAAILVIIAAGVVCANWIPWM